MNDEDIKNPHAVIGEFVFANVLFTHCFKTQDQFSQSMKKLYAKLDAILAIIQPPK